MLEPYLEEKLREYESQSTLTKKPTLPITNEGKINVRSVADDLGRRSWEQHFYRKPELASVLNAAAIYQELKPIGSRALDDAVDHAAVERIQRIGGDNSRLAKQLAEVIAENSALKRNNQSLMEQLGVLAETGMTVLSGK
ncbi:MAG: hypothetical protein KJ899_06125 [Gammaproteobacteria bacterium]|nr:hypothetical protein [Gammaproteobacteria bacterium]